ncbi:hypothetical protein KFZ56_09795 [Virgibacillus sp. NKC19-3]|uniref:hypothetical protein n=1 Tax=Virgibacillus saliphilus TaxID=2831674 RepID=UPI001C9AB42D|nr:hypothetical protein [Virgibacillus sp. NKC19-3]MBY7143346.1 hypothetical protein [Virgibacillus sp. NKC19-3]
MGSLIELIMDNLFIVVIIIAGIIGFFRNSSAEQEQDRRQTNRPRPTSTSAPSGGDNQPQQRRAHEAPSNQPAPASIEEQQSEQLGRLANQLQTETKDAMEKLPHDAIIGNTLREPNKNSSVEKEALKKQIKGNLGKTGLVNGIIMSEVLGSPRARKPYQVNHVKRNK